MSIICYSPEILTDLNNAARGLLAMYGISVGPDHKVHESTDELESRCWNAAVLAYFYRAVSSEPDTHRSSHTHKPLSRFQPDVFMTTH